MAAQQTTNLDPSSPERTDGRLLAAISNSIVGLHKELYGRGPTKARTIYHGDIVVCLLEGGFSRVERTLSERGLGKAVLEQRYEFQKAVQEEFKGAVEELTGRRVSAFMSSTHHDPDMMCEVFVLEPTQGRSDVRGVEPSEASV